MTKDDAVPVTAEDRELRAAVLSYLITTLNRPCSDGDMPDDRSDELDQIIDRHRGSTAGEIAELKRRLAEMQDDRDEWGEKYRRAATEVADLTDRLASLSQTPATAEIDGEHLHAAHETPAVIGAEAREVLARVFEAGFPVEAEKARKGLHFMLPSSWAVEAIQSVLDTPMVQEPLERWSDISDNPDAIVACGDRWRKVAERIGCQLHGFDDGYSASFITPDGRVIEVGPKFRAVIEAGPMVQEGLREALDRLAVKVLQNYRKRDGLTCYNWDHNRQRDERYMRETFAELVEPFIAALSATPAQADPIARIASDLAAGLTESQRND